MAQADIAKGAKVLLVDPLDSTTGALIEQYAKDHGVKTIDYDRLTLGGARSYYVSFDNVQVGTTIGQGEFSCLTSWNVPSPTVCTSRTVPRRTTTRRCSPRATTSPGGRLQHHRDDLRRARRLESAGTWDGPTALTDFQGAYTSHPSINAVLTPNDNNASYIISYLQGKGLKPKTIPFTGQDAQLTGIQNVISGYQCGTVYKPFWLETQAAASLAVYLRAGLKPPAGIVNGTTKDTLRSINVPSALLTPLWVTPSTVEATVVHDGQVSAQLCTSTSPTVAGSPQPTYAADCTTYGIH